MTTTFTGEQIDIYNYLKHDRDAYTDNVTGKALCLNTSPYCVIDIDISTKIDESRREEIRQSFIAAFCQECKIVKSTSGGLHLYCKWDHSVDGLTTNDYKDNYVTDEYKIDVFIPVMKDLRRLIVLPPSQVKNHFDKIASYELIVDINDDDLIPFDSMRQCLSEAFGENKNNQLRRSPSNKTNHLT